MEEKHGFFAEFLSDFQVAPSSWHFYKIFMIFFHGQCQGLLIHRENYVQRLKT